MARGADADANDTSSSSIIRIAAPRLFPFDCIVVTSPDEASAQSARDLLRRSLERTFCEPQEQQQIIKKQVSVISTCDPHGARCGSGGGTLAALELVSSLSLSFVADSDNTTVLILHAGGDSSRCPTQMIWGKAWTSLPSYRFPNPTIWLIDQLARLFEKAHLPAGTVVVAATDTLLTFCSSSTEEDSSSSSRVDQLEFEWDDDDDEALVLGVAVPAAFETAQNHGVYILPSNQNQAMTVSDPLAVWQKPSMEQLFQSSCDDNPCFAWIDTGVIIFLPKAVQVLEELVSNSVLSMCTRTGILAAYDEQKNGENQQEEQSIEAFAKEHALKIDLYTDLLHNFSWPGRQAGKDDDDDDDPLRQILSKISLKILTAPKGKFLHLGTTQELVDFMTLGCTTNNANNNANANHHHCLLFAQELSLHPRHHCCHNNNNNKGGAATTTTLFWNNTNTQNNNNNNTAHNSTFCSQVRIGPFSLIEYCDFAPLESVVIGRNCMVSGFRNTTTTTTTTSSEKSQSLSVPDGITFQTIALKDDSFSGQAAVEEQLLYMVLGTCDNVKAPFSSSSSSTLYGVPFQEFLDRTGMSPSALFTDEQLLPKDRNLWNARLHPRLSSEEIISFHGVYGWLDQLLLLQGDDDDDSVKDDPSFQRWLSLERLSLRELHAMADAEKEWNFRQDLESKILKTMQEEAIPHLMELLEDRRHDCPCDLRWIFETLDKTGAQDLLARVIVALEDLICKQLKMENHDICGRAFMILSALLSDFSDKYAIANVISEQSREFMSRSMAKVRRIRSISLEKTSVDEVSNLFRSMVEDRRRNETEDAWTDDLKGYSYLMEQLSFCMNELCVSSGYLKRLDCSSLGDGVLTPRRKITPVWNTWVESRAPVRVDLAGGWSDTPPICYEFGGAVTGLAVCVNQRKPLSCRCRLVRGKTGILLRTENRSLDDTTLSAVEIDVRDCTDLADFRNPMSDCALLKAALMCLSLIPENKLHSENVVLQDYINEFCSSSPHDCRLEIISVSLLPQGSGMGTSSILAAAALASITKCIGIGDLDYDYDFLLHGVLMLEQLLTSGGGWQDQAHGIIPGIKKVSSAPAQIPVALTVDRITISERFKEELERRMVLVFTGKTRLAKNILQDVLRRWCRRTHEVVNTTTRNVELASLAKDAIETEDIDRLGAILMEYSAIKVDGMAGKDSGALPDSCQSFMESLLERSIIKGASLCGAGGGGFMVLLLSEDQTKQSIIDFLMGEDTNIFNEYTVHSCNICEEGLTTSVLLP